MHARDIAVAGLDWITALRAPAIRALVEAGELQWREMAAITSPDYPGERLIVCRPEYGCFSCCRCPRRGIFTVRNRSFLRRALGAPASADTLGSIFERSTT
jgi:hypothetical protein